MKKTLLILTLLLVLATTAFSQKNRTYDFYIQAQGLVLTEPDFWTDYYSFGMGLGFGIEYPVSPAWSFVGGIDIRTYGLDKDALKEYYIEDYLASSVEVSGGRAWGISFSVLGKGKLQQDPTRMSPYFKGGFGITHITADDADVKYVVGNNTLKDDPGIESETNLSLTLGIGLEFPLGEGNQKLYMDIGYHLVMVDPDNVGTVPITLGLRF